MAMRINSKVFILFLIACSLSWSGAQEAPSPSPSKDDGWCIHVIRNAESDAAATRVGNFAVRKANELVPEEDSMTFGGVESARWGALLGGRTYCLVIRSRKRILKINGQIIATVFVDHSYLELLSWHFLPSD